MKIKEFKTEQWMTKYENDAKYNLTDTCVYPITYKQLLSLDKTNSINDIVLNYGEIAGDINLRKQILKLYKTGTINNIITSLGCLKANESVMMALLSKNDKVLTFTPSYQQFIDLPKSLGAKVITLKYHEDNNWLPNFKEIKDIFSKHRIKMVIINSPNNPTGTYWDLDMLNKLIKLCTKQNTYILIDEVYRGLNTSLEVSISDLYKYGISTSSLSKIYSLSGLRLGWIKANEEIINKLLILRDYSFISTGPILDKLALIALKNNKFLINRSKKIINENKKIINNFVSNNNKFELVMPQYGTVCFLKYNSKEKSEDLCIRLLKEKGLFFVPGSCFDLEYHLRLSFTNDPSITRKGLKIFNDLL